MRLIRNKLLLVSMLLSVIISYNSHPTFDHVILVKKYTYIYTSMISVTNYIL